MEPCELARLQRRARWAYELGRIKWSLAHGLLALAWVAIASMLSPTWTPVFYVLGCALTLLCILLPYQSNELGRQVRGGLLAGALPTMVALASANMGGCADECSAWCAPLCGGAALIGGAWLSRAQTPYGALLVALLAATVGCLAIGMGAMFGALLGLTAGTLPSLARDSSGT